MEIRLQTKSTPSILTAEYPKLTADRNAAALNSDLDCEEAGQYPVYDSENPEHNTTLNCLTGPRRSGSRSPLKAQIQKRTKSLRSKSPSPSRLVTSSRKALNELANSVRGKATGSPIASSQLLQDPNSGAPNQEKTVSPKKSVHWHSSDTTVLGSQPSGTSPKDIKMPSAMLPEFQYSDHFLGSAVALTARIPSTPILTALDQHLEKPNSIDIQRPSLAEIEQPALPTPMPGTNLPLEDPFDDAMAVFSDNAKVVENGDCVAETSVLLSDSDVEVAALVSMTPDGFTGKIGSIELSDGFSGSRISSVTCDNDDQSCASEDSDLHTHSLAHVYPRPPNMDISRDPNFRDQEEVISSGDCKMIPELKASPMAAYEGSATQHTFPRSRPQGDEKYDQYSQSCRLPSLTEPIKHNLSPPEVSPRQPPCASLTTAKKLPPFNLHANVTAVSPPREVATFQYTDSSDEHMELVDVDETEWSWRTRKKFPGIGRSYDKTPSPAQVPLPETPV